MNYIPQNDQAESNYSPGIEMTSAKENNTIASQNSEHIFVCKNTVKLNQGISRTNFICAQINILLIISNFSFSGTLQPMILQDAEYFAIPANKIGTIMGYLTLLLSIVSLVSVPLTGFLSDAFGRQKMIRIGACLIYSGYIIVALSNDLLTFFMAKILVSLGGAMLITSPLNADYVHDSTKGKVSGIQFAMIEVGALIGALFVFILLKIHLKLGTIHVVGGFIIFFALMINSFGLKAGNQYYKKNFSSNEDNIETQETPKEKFKEAIKTIKNNYWLQISLIISILCQADLYILIINLAIFLKSFTDDVNSENNAYVSMYQIIYYSTALLSSVLVGHLCDKIAPIKLLIPGLLLSIIGFCFSFWITKVLDPCFFILMMLVGFGIPTCKTTQFYLAIRYYPNKIRGTLTGLFSMCGSVVVIFLSVIGGYCFDKYSKFAPFMIFTALLITGAIFVLYIYNKNRDKIIDEGYVTCN